ncbi:MAG: hypothetical protein P1U74_09150 [Legionellaceae bacterium]|nr:hypothetical protein [Legionellaceae bacterium]
MRKLEELRNELLMYSAEIGCGCIVDFFELHKLCDEILNQGIYCESLLDFSSIDTEDLRSEECYQIAIQLFKELDIYIYEDDIEAQNHVMLYHLDRIINKNFDLYSEIFSLYMKSPRGCCNFEFFGPLRNICLYVYGYANEYQSYLKTEEEDKQFSESLMDEARIAYAKLKESLPDKE